MTVSKIRYDVVASFTAKVDEFPNRESMFGTLGREIDKLEKQYGGLLTKIEYNTEIYNNGSETGIRITSVKIETSATGVSWNTETS